MTQISLIPFVTSHPRRKFEKAEEEKCQEGFHSCCLVGEEKTERRQSQRVASQLARSSILEQKRTSSAPSHSIAVNPDDEEVLLERESRQSRSLHPISRTLYLQNVQ